MITTFYLEMCSAENYARAPHSFNIFTNLFLPAATCYPIKLFNCSLI